jgi:hypothetical protein
MIRTTDSLKNLELRARDGVLGKVKDFYFDDEHWKIRYLVVETGTWLNSRKVLLATSVIDAIDWDRALLPVDLTQEQVRRSPGIDTEQPVSREQEAGLHEHYGWPAYWTGAGYLDGGGLITPVPLLDTPAAPTVPATAEAALASVPQIRTAPNGDPRLRSGKAVLGYGLEASDGAIGHIEDFLFEDHTWELRYAVIDTRNWLPGKKVVVSPDWISTVSWSHSRVYIDLTREAIKAAPAYDPSAPFDEEYERRLHRELGVHEPAGHR